MSTRRLLDPAQKIQQLEQRIRDVEARMGRAGGHSTTPTSLSFAADWANSGSPYEDGRYWIVGGKTVHLEGRVERTATGTATDVVATLPAGFRPANTHVFICGSSDATSGGLIRVDVKATGDVEVVGLDTGSGEWVSLSGICFNVA